MPGRRLGDEGGMMLLALVLIGFLGLAVAGTLVVLVVLFGFSPFVRP